MDGRWAAAASAALLSCALACGAPTFICNDADDCGSNGVCEPNGGCSFPDETCASGRRFAKHTASANECVPAQQGTSSTSGDPTSGGPSTSLDTLDPSTSSSESTSGDDSSSTTVDIIPDTTATTTGDESSTGEVPNVDFYDDFERPDSPDVGNGWIEKTPEAFALIDGGIRRVGTDLAYANNLVYRPDGAWLDAEAILELQWLDITDDYGSPQCSLRTQLDDIDVAGSVTGYLLFVNGSNGELTITRQIDGVFTQQHISALASEVIVGAPYRLRLRVEGNDPVVLDGYLEQWADDTWTVHTEVHGMDDTTERITTPGTLSVSGHVQLEHWTYEAVSLEIFDR